MTLQGAGDGHLLVSVLLSTGDFSHIGLLTWTSFSSSIKRGLHSNNDKHFSAVFQNVKFFTIYHDTWFVKCSPQSLYKLDWNPCNLHLSKGTGGVLMFSWAMDRWDTASFSRSLQVPQPPLSKATKERKRAAMHGTALEKRVWTNELCWLTHTRKWGGGVASQEQGSLAFLHKWYQMCTLFQEEDILHLPSFPFSESAYLCMFQSGLSFTGVGMRVEICPLCPSVLSIPHSFTE